jgi:hypothetical protein
MKIIPITHINCPTIGTFANSFFEKIGDDLASIILSRLSVVRRFNFLLGLGIYKMPFVADFHGLFSIFPQYGMHLGNIKIENIEQFVSKVSNVSNYFSYPFYGNISSGREKSNIGEVEISSQKSPK